jgi:hypothetical protein
MTIVQETRRTTPEEAGPGLHSAALTGFGEPAGVRRSQDCDGENASLKGEGKGESGVPAPGVSSSDPDQHGRARAMTVFSPVRPWYGWHWPPGGVVGLRLIFRVARTKPGDSVRALSFIHFLQFAVIRRLPDYGQPRERLRQPLLMFESNYNGTFEQYIDAFSNILTSKMKMFWGTSYGFPGPRPVKPFKRYIHDNEFTANHYHSAYPTATTTMIRAALALSGPLREFTMRAATISPEQFSDEYRSFLTDHQGDL